MSDTFTTGLGLQVPTVGGDSGTWGTVLNTDLALIDNAISSRTAITLVGQTALVFSFVAGGSDQFKQPLWIIGGAAAAGGTTITLPAIAFQRWYYHNASTGNITLTLNTGGATLTFTPAQAGNWFLIASDSVGLSIPAIGNPINAQGTIYSAGNIVTPSTVQGGGVLATGYVAGANLNITNNGTVANTLSVATLNASAAITGGTVSGTAVTSTGVVSGTTLTGLALAGSSNVALVSASSGGSPPIPNQQITVLGGTGTFASLSPVLTLANGSITKIIFQMTVTALTFTAAGFTQINAPTTVAAGKIVTVYAYNGSAYFGV